MRKPNYRFERAERDRAKRPETTRSCSGSRKGRRPLPRMALPNQPPTTSRAKAEQTSRTGLPRDSGRRRLVRLRYRCARFGPDCFRDRAKAIALEQVGQS